MAWRVGVDSGGTFTDLCLFDTTSGAIRVWKVASTPDDPSRAIADGVAEARGARGRPRLPPSPISVTAPRSRPTR